MLIQKSLREIQAKLEKYATASIPEILAVSKGQSPDKIKEAYAQGLRHFGENYLQDLEAKAAELKDLDIHWHFIGHIQTRKIPKIVEICDSIFALESLKHAQKISECAAKLSKSPYPIYISVNAADEEGKSGVKIDKCLEFVEQIKRLNLNLSIEGIMSVPPVKYSDDNCKEIPELYVRLRRLADQVGRGKLSLGMSRDLGIATQCGSDMVRIGTDLFGQRSR